MLEVLKKLTDGQEIRQNLSELRKLIKEEEKRNVCLDWVNKNQELILSFLDNEDAKSRKLAALLLGDLHAQFAKNRLWECYEKETTLFVKSAYLEALYELDVEDILSDIKKSLVELNKMEVLPENRKHMDAQIKALRAIVIRYEGINKHSFSPENKEYNMILTTNPVHKEIVRRQIGEEISPKSSRIHPMGVEILCEEPKKIWKVRTFREVLFPIHVKNAESKFLPSDPTCAADILAGSDMYDLLKSLHKQEGPFYYRVELKSPKDLAAKSAFIKKFISALEQKTSGRFINSATDYEIEIRLVETKDGSFYPCMKLYTFKDPRFSYRKNTIATSIHPSTAALIVALSASYMKENAQIMDPFCGVGTMLIERNKAVSAREMYATDIFGDAIILGRENAKNAGTQINFIHRDFFDFKHDYLFDELITNMPMAGKKTKEEVDAFYARFFKKAPQIMTDDGVIIMYTDEIGFVKKQLRLNKQFALLQETKMQKKGDFYLLIIGMKR